MNSLLRSFEKEMKHSAVQDYLGPASFVSASILILIWSSISHKTASKSCVKLLGGRERTDLNKKYYYMFFDHLSLPIITGLQRKHGLTAFNGLREDPFYGFRSHCSFMAQGTSEGLREWEWAWDRNGNGIRSPSSLSPSPSPSPVRVRPVRSFTDPSIHSRPSIRPTLLHLNAYLSHSIQPSIENRDAIIR